MGGFDPPRLFDQVQAQAVLYLPRCCFPNGRFLLTSNRVECAQRNRGYNR